MDRSEIFLEFESDSRNESFARIVVTAFVARLDPDMEEIADIKTSISEAVTNSIIHAYPEEKGKIQLRCVVEGNQVFFEITDFGIGIADLEKAREPLYTSKPGFDRAGMGFSFMESFMDSLTVESKVGEGTKVHMIKKIGGEKKGM